jgi:alkylmercury lyase
VETRLANWPGVYRDGDGRLVGLWGLAAEPVSAHEVRVDGHGVAWAWCALDPLFIVPLLGHSARVSSRCPTTGERIDLTVTPGAVSEVTPTSAVMSLLVPECAFDAEVRQTFCHFVHLFSSPDAAAPWTAEHDGTFTLSVPDAAEVGRRLAACAFPAVSAG